MNRDEPSSPLVRRLAAIVCGDVVGYSRLMGADEEGTHSRVMYHQREIIEPTIAEHHGRVIKYTGDGFLALFDSPLEAVRCAIVIQQSVLGRNMSAPKGRRIEYRMGVNLGDVIVDGEDVYGDGVNIAVRLEGAAAPGTVNISGGVYEQIKNKLVCGYQSLGDEKLKNITDPVRIYRVLPDPAAVDRFQPRRRVGQVAAAAAVLALGIVGGSAFIIRQRTPAPVAATSAEAVVARPAPPAATTPGQLAGLPLPPPPLPPVTFPGPEPAAIPPPARAPAEREMPPPQPNVTATLLGPGRSRTTAPEPEPRVPTAGNDLRDCATCPSLVKVPGGSFTMGSNDDPAERPVRQVSLEPFAISRFPVTVREWKACVAAKACLYEPKGTGDEPVRNVSYNDVQQYIRWISAATSQRYRLPSEAEWEYAARAGSTTPFWWGRLLVAGVVHCKGCGGPYNPDAPPVVGGAAANPFGLHDVAGSVAQWVADCWSKDYQGAPRDGTPRDRPNCRERVLRGGSWLSSDVADLRVTARAFYDAAVRYPTHGFRVSRSLKQGE
jgi:formylglycine-generating enzyme required for sulfatase activity/class 3 adenylate cyclase